MAATDELRRMLDEAGVEWKEYGYENHTWWNGSENVGWHAENRPSVTGSYVKIEAVLTPAQAIAATVGCGTCHDAAGKQMAFFACSACGATIERKHPRFCYGCGRKVVDG